MPQFLSRIRLLIPAAVAIAVAIALFFAAQLPHASAREANQAASGYAFRKLPVAMPPGYRPTQDIRKVNPAYQHLAAWVSSVGAGIAMTDVTGHGRDDGMCIVDPRTDEVVISYAPTAPETDRFTPFTLEDAPLPVTSTMAPMGCVPGDYNQDGRTDFLVYYWGRSPIVYLARSTASHPSPAAYRPVELLSGASSGRTYAGPKWNTNAVAVADFAGTGHPDLLIGNYFPDSGVLDPHGSDDVQMPSSFSDALNGGGDYIYRWTGGTAGANPTVSYRLVPGAIPYADSTGWTLAAASADLTGTGLPDLYIANDFGPDHLLHNDSRGGNVKFTVAVGERTPTTPKSFVLGKSSFKGMGVDFGDLADNGKFDMMVSDITTPWGLEESNLVFMNGASTTGQMKRDLASGYAPFTQDAKQMGLAWTGWAWDLKMADFLNSGSLNIVQSDGFVKGTIDRWPWLQEVAMNNDDVVSNPAGWLNVEQGDDLAGRQCLAFYAKTPSGGYVNISENLGLCARIPTRGIATADTRGDGRQDFAVARQWGPPAFYENEAPNVGNYLGLRLFRPAADEAARDRGLGGQGTPAVGTTVRISTPGHTQVSQLDAGSGGGGKRSSEVSFGLGAYRGPVAVRLKWADSSGHRHDEVLRLAPGTHTLMLTSTAKEVSPE